MFGKLTLFKRKSSGTKKYQSEHFGHKCDLASSDDLIERYICGGICVYFRRKLKSIQICSMKNARTKLFFKSSNAVFNEKYKHLEFDFDMIHPFSIGRAYWEFFMFGVYYVALAYFPLYICLSHMSYDIFYIRLILDIICSFDILMNFNTGYQHPLTKRVIMDRRMVMRHYLASWFFIDILTSVNPDILVSIAHTYLNINIWYVRLFSLLKIFRINTLLLYLTRLKEWYQLSWFLYQLAKLLTIISLMILWHAAVMFLVAYSVGEEWIDSENIFLSFKLVITRTIGCILVIGEKGTINKTMPIFALEVIFTVTGWIYRIIITTQIALMVLKANPLRTNYSKLIQEFEEYVITKRLPKIVRKRVLDYLNFKYQGKFYRESVVTSTLSNRLKHEMEMHICQSILKTVNIFSNLPIEIIKRLSTRVKHEIYLQNDIIVTLDTPSEDVIFIVSGMAAIYNNLGKEVRHFLEGDSYGEKDIFLHEATNEFTIVAIDSCEVYKIRHIDFINAMIPYPEVWVKICKSVRMDMLDPLVLLYEFKTSRRESKV